MRLRWFARLTKRLATVNPKRGCCSEFGIASRVISAEDALIGLENTDLNCAGVNKRNSREKV
jgi:hypothetical protein